MNLGGVLCHAVYTISCLGGFYIYLIINELIMGNFKQSSVHGGTSIDLSTWLMLCSIPVIFLFISGCYSARLAIAIEKVQDARREALRAAPIVVRPELNENMCVSCEEKPKECVFIPCGHKCLCKDCGDRLKKGGQT